jgi:tetratricopeptide (TPR) repeat protein
LISPLLLWIALAGANAQARTAPASTSPIDQAITAATELRRAGRIDEGDTRLAEAATRLNSARGWIELARSQAGRRDFPAALRSLERARALAPNSEEIASAYAQVALNQRQYAPAIRALEPLVAMCPTVAQYRYMLGVAYLQLGDDADAVTALEHAQRIEPDRPPTLLALGLALSQGKRYKDAVPLLQRAMTLAPDNVDVVAALAEAELGAGDTTRAMSDATRALAQSPGHGTANLVMGMLLLDSNRAAESRAALEKAVAASPDSPKAHYQLSLACARLGDHASADAERAAYQRALREAEARVKALRRPESPMGATP